MLIERDTIIPYDVPIYAEAAQTFIDVYEETADPAAACAQMDAVLQADPDQSAPSTGSATTRKCWTAIAR
jgi:hypothetical protein